MQANHAINKLIKKILLMTIGGVVTWLMPLNSLAQMPAKQTATGTRPDDAASIVVSATRIPRLSRDVGVSATVVPSTRIEELNAPSLNEVLDEVAAVRVKPCGSMGAESSIALRGSSPQQVLVMVDGRPLNPPSLGQVDLAMISVDQISRIEVIRGPSSVLYGAGAMAGVVNIISKDPPEKFQTDLAASYGTRNSRLLKLDNGASFGEFGYLITLSQNASDGWRKNSSYDAYNLSGKASYDISQESRLTLNSGFTRQNKGVPGATYWPSPNAKQYDRQYWFDLTHTYEFETNSWLTSKIFINQDWQHYQDPDSFLNNINRNQKAGVDIQHTQPWGERHLFLGGIYLANDHVNLKDANAVSTIGGNRDLFTGAGFLQDEISLLERFIATPGLRCDIQSQWGAEFSPKLSGLYKISETTRLRASLGRGFRGPTVNELYWQDDYTQGNPDLKAEESISYDLGCQQQLGEKSSLNIALFRSHMNNLISWFDNGQGIYQAQNVDDALLQGLEAELTIQIAPGVFSSLNYTLLDAKDTSNDYDGNLLVYRSKHKIGGTLGYQSPWGLKLNMNAQYSGPVYTDRANTEELGGFMTLGAYAAQTVAQGVEIFARADNILNKQYQLLNGYPMPGASLMGGIKASF